MELIRAKKLERNFALMFWIQALTEVKVINVISTLFMVHRGLTLAQIFWTATTYSIVAVLTEIPSSYLADKWNRKNLIRISLLFSLLSWIINVFAWGFLPFLVAIGVYSFSNSLMSGTDEALVFDTSKELGTGNQSLKQLGKFFSGQRIFKIFTPIIAVLIARNLSEFQFVLILLIDIVANLVALVVANYLTEPQQHYFDDSPNKRIFKDAVNLIYRSPELARLILNRTLMFLSIFIIWRISSEYFKSINIAVIWIGITTASYQLIIYLLNINSHLWFKKLSSEKYLNIVNIICTISLGIFLFNHLWWQSRLIALLSFSIINISEVTRWPYFSDISNKLISSFNRATTLSLTNLLNCLIQIPFLVLSSALIVFGYDKVFFMTFMLGLIVNLSLPLRKPNSIATS